MAMLKITKYMSKREWLLLACSLLFVLAQVFLDLKLPDYMAKITRLVEQEGSYLSEILMAGGMMLLCSLGSLLASFIVAAFAARIASNFSRRLRALQFENIQRFGMQEMQELTTSSLITRSTNDVTQLQLVIAMGLQVAIKAPITAVWAILKIAGKGWAWTSATGVAVLLLIALMGVVVLFAMPKFRVVQGLTDKLNLVTREHLVGLRVVRAYNAEAYQQEKFETANADLTQNNLEAQRILAVMFPGMGLIMNGLSLAVYWIGAYLISAATGETRLVLFSDMVVFINYAMQVVMSFMMLSIIFIMLPRATVAAARVLEVIETKPAVQDGIQTEGLADLHGEISFEQVSFRYPKAEDYALRDVSFHARRGETVAFIGATGSGKSTLINLLPRFYDVSEGCVRVDGVDVRDYTQEALHNKFGYVAQKTELFSGTVFSNVAYGESTGEPYTKADVEEAVEIAQGRAFVESLVGEYQATVSRGGANLSGGQRQRLSIARALCRKPEILIFDDSFSALDYRTDRDLRQALNKHTKDCTTLIVAQRIGTIRDADRILVLDEGRVVGEGTHTQLMETCETYREIALSQLTKEELA